MWIQLKTEHTFITDHHKHTYQDIHTDVEKRTQTGMAFCFRCLEDDPDNIHTPDRMS